MSLPDDGDLEEFGLAVDRRSEDVEPQSVRPDGAPLADDGNPFGRVTFPNFMALLQQQAKHFADLQDALDRKLERDVGQDMAKLKVDILRDGARIGRDLLSGLFATD